MDIWIISVPVLLAYQCLRKMQPVLEHVIKPEMGGTAKKIYYQLILTRFGSCSDFIPYNNEVDFIYVISIIKL